MVKDNSGLSPEKRLLKLIEEPNFQSAKGSAVRGSRLTLFSIGALRGRWIFARVKLASFLRSWGGPLDIKKINGILTLLGFVVAAYFVASFFSLATKFSAIPSFSFKTEGSAKAEILKQVSQLKALDTYMEKVRSRDIFKIGAQPATEEVAKPDQSAQKAQRETVLNKYKLVGISWSDNPDAMIEDSEAKKTFFLKRGQVMSDGVKIQAIFKDKVVLNYAGAEVELR